MLIFNNLQKHKFRAFYGLFRNCDNFWSKLPPEKVAMPTRGSVGCDDGKIRANECKGKFICTLLSAAEFG